MISLGNIYTQLHLKIIKNGDNMKSIYDFKYEIIHGGHNHVDGGVQVDEVVISEDGGEEYYFNIERTADHVIVTYDEEPDYFINDFGVKENGVLEDSGLQDWIASMDSPGVIGEQEKIEGYLLTVENFSHQGGYERGFVEINVEGADIQFDVLQDATGAYRVDEVSYATEKDQQLAESIGLQMDSDLIDVVLRAYDKLSSEARDRMYGID